MTTFDPAAWTERLAHCVELELLTWHVRMSLDRLRGLALDCCPWHAPALIISFLTEREQFGFEGADKWDTAAWRFFDFTSGPDTHWPYAAEVMREAHAYYGDDETGSERAERRDELCRCCAKALRHPAVERVLRERYQLAPDFEVYAGHPDEHERNFCDEG